LISKETLEALRLYVYTRPVAMIAAESKPRNAVVDPLLASWITSGIGEAI